jgi:hypothetical protein
MVLFFVFNTVFFILLVTQCCGMSTSKRQNVTRRIERLFGIQERPTIEVMEEREGEGEQEGEKEEGEKEGEKDERRKQIEKSREIIGKIKDDLDKKNV